MKTVRVTKIRKGYEINSEHYILFWHKLKKNRQSSENKKNKNIILIYTHINNKNPSILGGLEETDKTIKHGDIS